MRKTYLLFLFSFLCSFVFSQNSGQINGDFSLNLQSYAEDEGCTACVVLVTPEKIFCSNAGDSRAVLMRGATAIGLSEDHKPDNEDESKRI